MAECQCGKLIVEPPIHFTSSKYITNGEEQPGILKHLYVKLVLRQSWILPKSDSNLLPSNDIRTVYSCRKQASLIGKRPLSRSGMGWESEICEGIARYNRVESFLPVQDFPFQSHGCSTGVCWSFLQRPQQEVAFQCPSLWGQTLKHSSMCSAPSPLPPRPADNFTSCTGSVRYQYWEKLLLQCVLIHCQPCCFAPQH